MSVFLAARADFGFGNPNLAAALFAMLAVGVWGIPIGRGAERSAVFLGRLAASGICAALIVLTASRGGLVALAAGVFVLWAAGGFLRPKVWQGLALAGVLAVLVTFSVSGRMGERVAESSPEDGSITSRVAIFRAVPAMLTAAPQGWGTGQSAVAYQNWFQAPEDLRTYKHLLSTHATWMVERGWGGRFVYLLGWGVVLVLCGKVPAALAVWVVFGVAGMFSHVGGDGRLWVVPGLALAAAAWSRRRARVWPGWRTGRNLLAGTLGVTVLLGISGVWTGAGIFFDGNTIRVGREEPGEWFLAPDPAVLGMTAGKMIRQRAPVGVALHADALGAQRPRRVVLSGRAVIPEGTLLEEPYDVVWLNPPARLDAASRQVVEQAENAVMVWGGLRTDGHPRELKKWFTALPQAEWREVPGRGLLLESWRED